MGLISGMLGNAEKLDMGRAHHEFGRLLGQGEQIHAGLPAGSRRHSLHEPAVRSH